MNSEVMKRRIAAMLCCAVLTASMPMGALAEGETQAEAPAVQEIVPEQTDGAVQTNGAAQTYKKFKLKPELVEGVLCVSVSGASVLDVQVRVLNAKGIHASVNFWGYDVNHDWPWWYKQTAYYLPMIVGNP